MTTQGVPFWYDDRNGPGTGKRKDYLLRRTLGVALYRSGRTGDAVTTLGDGLTGGGEQADAFGLFCLAVCHARLGEPARAKGCFDRAVKWTEAHMDRLAPHLEELKVFRAEAEAALRAL